MRPPNRNHRQSRSAWNTSRTQSLFRSEIGLDASRHIYLLSEGKGEEFFLDIPSHRAHRALADIRYFWCSITWCGSMWWDFRTRYWESRKGKFQCVDRSRTVPYANPNFIVGYYGLERVERFCVSNCMEHRTGVEPVNTGFADQRVSHFATGAHLIALMGSLAVQGCP